jgi:hypothetical protein
MDFDSDAVPDECQIDCNENSIPDYYEIEEGLVTDCNSNEIPDDCDWFVLGDCDEDGLIDGCEEDINEDIIPDDCQCIADLTEDGIVSIQDLLQLVSAWGDNPEPHSEPVPEDMNADMYVDVEDLIYLITEWGDCSVYAQPEVTGACCLYMCDEFTEIGCNILNGTYFGDNSTCDSVDCQLP